MMKQLSLLFIIVFFSSCGGGFSACDCAKIRLEADVIMLSTELSEEEGKKKIQEWDIKYRPCQEKINQNSQFKSDWKKCYKEKREGAY